MRSENGPFGPTVRVAGGFAGCCRGKVDACEVADGVAAGSPGGQKGKGFDAWGSGLGVGPGRPCGSRSWSRLAVERLVA